MCHGTHKVKTSSIRLRNLSHWRLALRPNFGSFSEFGQRELKFLHRVTRANFDGMPIVVGQSAALFLDIFSKLIGQVIAKEVKEHFKWRSDNFAVFMWQRRHCCAQRKCGRPYFLTDGAPV